MRLACIHKQSILRCFIAKAIEYMIVDALSSAEPFMKIADQIDIPKKFLYLTDDIMTRIESSEAPVSLVRIWASII